MALQVDDEQWKITGGMPLSKIPTSPLRGCICCQFVDPVRMLGVKLNPSLTTNTHTHGVCERSRRGCARRWC